MTLRMGRCMGQAVMTMFMKSIKPQVWQRLLERLPVYPEDLLGRPEFFHPQVRQAALRLADGEGWARPRSSGDSLEAA